MPRLYLVDADAYDALLNAIADSPEEGDGDSDAYDNLLNAVLDAPKPQLYEDAPAEATDLPPEPENPIEGSYPVANAGTDVADAPAASGDPDNSAQS